MKKFAHIFLSLFVLLALLSSCSINGTLQGLLSYYDQTQKESKVDFVKISEVSDCLRSGSDSAKVLVANGTELRNCLHGYENSVVYIWSPKCKSQYCYSLDLLQETCRQKGIELFIVAEYYDSYYMSKYYDITHPIIGADVKYYKTNFTSKYLSKFISDLTNGTYVLYIRNNIYCNFLSFKNGEFERSFNAIEDL